jgi:hypothetical protein
VTGARGWYEGSMTTSGRAPAPACTTLLLALVLVVSACGSNGVGSLAAAPEESAQAVASSPTLRVVAVGDIACEPTRPTVGTECRQAATAALTRSLRPDLVLTLGDHQYDQGSAAEFAGSYDKSWGSLLPITRPTIGNHEYGTAGAKAYYSYFAKRQPGPPGYYRVAANGWNIYVLNSNCDKVSCGYEAWWLRSQMKAHPSRCSIVTMHHPRYSSGLEHGNNTAVKPLWAAAYRFRNDIVLSGHDHDYERFRPMDGRGHLKNRRGMQEFVSGTGGRNLYHLGTRKRGSVYFQARTPGVLFLGLKAGAYSWSYRSTSGAVLDAGSRRCH